MKNNIMNTNNMNINFANNFNNNNFNNSIMNLKNNMYNNYELKKYNKLKNNFNFGNININNNLCQMTEINKPQNTNINNANHQMQIYYNIQRNNYSSPPNYKNNLNINNINISQKNKNLIIKQISKIVQFSFITPLEIIYKEQYGRFTNTTKGREKCPICLDEFYNDIIEENTQALFLKPINIYLFHQIDTIKLFRCEDHFIHIECLSNLINNKSSGFKCPTCQKIYGIMIGDMPPGKMKVTLDKKNKCAGYPKEETIVIDYYFKNGKKDGNYYTGTERRSYLPNNKEGREILAMLKIAFDRKLTFTVGTSTTTGQENTVVWNGIHHKTSLRGGAKNHGYPDPTYFSRVTEELAAKGIIKDEFGTGELEGIAINLLYNN